MSSTLAKEFENKLIVALIDARVAVLNEKKFITEQQRTLEMIDEQIHTALDAHVSDDLNKIHKATTKAIALLINYQIKFL